MTTIRLFKHYIRIPFLLLGITEGLIFYSSVFAGVYLRFMGNLYPSTSAEQEPWPLELRALVFSVIMFLSLTSMGLYQAQRREGLSNVLLRVIVSYALGTAASAVIFYLIPQLYLGRGVLVLAVVISFLPVAVCRAIFRNVVDRDTLKRRILCIRGG